MVAYAHDCDEDRLRRLLDGQLEQDEQDHLAAHLDACEECRLALDAMATDGRSWKTLREFIGGDTELETGADPVSNATDGDVHPHITGDEDDRIRSILKLLDPPDDPRHLGRLGPYEVHDVIGQGGMGIVLKASDKGLGRTVAIKVLGPEWTFLASARQRFAREARAAASVAHEHVVAIHAVDSWKGIPYLVMQYVSGISLQDRIDREGPLRIVELLRIGMQVALGLAAAHAQGLVHRDIKPANVLLESGVERVKITDFGLARATADMSLSQSGVACGTPQYMAPEQTRCANVDPRADLFSLGSLMYAMCAGIPRSAARRRWGYCVASARIPRAQSASKTRMCPPGWRISSRNCSRRNPTSDFNRPPRLPSCSDAAWRTSSWPSRGHRLFGCAARAKPLEPASLGGPRSRCPAARRHARCGPGWGLCRDRRLFHGDPSHQGR